MTQGVISVNPNTMYPLLRELEANGLVDGRWELPDRRTRRYYSITPAGKREYKRLEREVEPFLDSVIRSVSLIKHQVYGDARARDSATR
jgi:DNA-binding PadR family transcriptional regulator